MDTFGKEHDADDGSDIPSDDDIEYSGTPRTIDDSRLSIISITGAPIDEMLKLKKIGSRPHSLSFDIEL